MLFRSVFLAIVSQTFPVVRSSTIRNRGESVMNQLRPRDIRPGDIMLKVYDGSIFSRVISFGQMGLDNSKVVHAGIMFDSNYIIEAQASGISANDIRVQNKGVAYLVFRCKYQRMREGAATCAKMLFDIHKRQGSMKYNLIGRVRTRLGGLGAPKSAQAMDMLLDKILRGGQNRLFCSQLVVYIYQFVAQQSGVAAAALFNMSDAMASPAVLATALHGSATFEEAGYMISNER